MRVILHLILLSLLLVGAASAAPLTGEAQHVIIVMKEQAPASAGPAELAAFADQSQGDMIATLDKMGAADVTPLWSVNAVAATLSPEEVQKIAARSDVAMVVPDRIVTIDADTPSEKGERGINFYKPAGETIDYINPPPMDSEDIAWGVEWIEAPEVWQNGFNGTGVTVAVVDTGIYADHPDLAGKVVGWDDLVNYLTEPYDDYGHGTHCAGTIAGTGASGTKTGVAPGARLIGIKVFDSNGRANSST
ncbi:MAG TPA: S8 family serine peptidase, partial [Methanoculleus sp.]|nr:S8 family serine peptidase [Methanoculleus sp.]